jgi:exopolysaccharide biosynthesis operon protein EpsL
MEVITGRAGRATGYGLLVAAVWVLTGEGTPPANAQGYPPAQGGPPAPVEAGSFGYDALKVIVGGSVAHDSNLFRRSGLLLSPQSETIGTGYIGLRFDKPYGQQRFQLDATATAYRYDKFSYLDFDGFDYRAAWLWHLGPRVSGSLRASRTQTPTQFQDQTGFQRNTRTSENYGFDVDGWIVGGWHVLAGLAHSSSKGENTALQNQPNYRQDNLDAGVRYLFRSGSDVAVLWRRNEGDQDDQFVNNVVVPSTDDYTQDDSEIRGTWIVSAKSTLTGRVTYLDRRYDRAPLRDFSGTAGDIGYQWRLTDKVNLRLSATRNIAPFQSLSSTYRTSNTFSLAPTWQATAKTSVSVGLRRAYDDYPTAVAGVPDREDTTDHASLSADWTPLRSLSISASVFREKRSSNLPSVEYSTTIGKIGAAFTF